MNRIWIPRSGRTPWGLSLREDLWASGSPSPLDLTFCFFSVSKGHIHMCLFFHLYWSVTSTSLIWTENLLFSILSHFLVPTSNGHRTISGSPLWRNVLKLIDVLGAQPMVQNWVSASWEWGQCQSWQHVCWSARAGARMHSACWPAGRVGSGARVTEQLCRVSEGCGLRSGERGAVWLCKHVALVGSDSRVRM